MYRYGRKRPTVDIFFPHSKTGCTARFFSLPKEKSRIKIPVRFEKESIRETQRPHIKSESFAGKPTNMYSKTLVYVTLFHSNTYNLQIVQFNFKIYYVAYL